MKEKAILVNELKQFEKQLYKTNSLLSELKSLENSLRTIEVHAEKLESLTESHPELEKAFKEQLKGKEVIDQFRKLESNVQNMKTIFQAHEEKGFRADLFLDNFRGNAAYGFLSAEDSRAFIETAFSFAGSKGVLFGPKINGIVNVKALSEQLGFERASTNFLNVPVEELKKVWNYLDSRTGKTTEFVFETKTLRISFLGLKQLFVKSSNSTIKSLDSVSRDFSAKILK